MLVSSVQELQMRDTKQSGSNLQPPRPSDADLPLQFTQRWNFERQVWECVQVWVWERGDGGLGGRGGASVEEWLEIRVKRQKKKTTVERGKLRGMSVRVSFFFFQVTEQIKTTTKMYICQTWEASDAKCQRARWNTDKFPPQFFSPIYLNRCCGFLFLLYKNCRKRPKRKTFPPTEVLKKNKTTKRKKKINCVNLEILLLH